MVVRDGCHGNRPTRETYAVKRVDGDYFADEE